MLQGTMETNGSGNSTSMKQQFKCDLQLVKDSFDLDNGKLDANGKGLHGW